MMDFKIEQPAKDPIGLLLSQTGEGDSFMHDPDAAHIVVNHGKVLGLSSVPGLNVDIDEIENGIDAKIYVDDGIKIEKKVHICFGMLPKRGKQIIKMDINIHRDASISILAHCVFANSEDIEHIMDAKIVVAEGAGYEYQEKHVHGQHGGVKVIAKAEVYVGKRARFKSEFDLIKGSVGLIDLDYETFVEDYGLVDMMAKINGRQNDIIKINEKSHLKGKHSVGVLTSKIAVRDNAEAKVLNTITADGDYARGHVDCKEIVKDNGRANAIPVVDVRNAKAHVTHEAAIGSVDNKQLETLMSRGLSEDDAADLIIEGLLS